MIVKDLLTKDQTDRIVSAALDLCSVDEEERSEVAQSYTAFIERLESIRPVETGHLLLGLPLLDDGKKILDVPLYRTADVKNIHFDKLAQVENLSALSLDELEEMRQSLSLPEAYAFELSPWEEVLGYGLCAENVADVGAVRLAAEIIYEMTFFGFTEEEVEAERQKLQESIEESENIETLPQEERDRHYKSVEDVFAELGAWDIRTEMEKQESHRKLEREITENKRRVLRMFQKYGASI